MTNKKILSLTEHWVQSEKAKDVATGETVRKGCFKAAGWAINGVRKELMKKLKQRKN
jgi:uncharacterized protein YjhX (UPF0386 family)